MPHQNLIVRAKHDGKVDFVDHSLSQIAFSIDLDPQSPETNKEITWSLDVSPDGNYVVAGGGKVKDGYLSIIDVKKQKLVARKSRRYGMITSVKFHPSGRFLFSCSNGGGVDMWSFLPASQTGDPSESSMKLTFLKQLTNLGETPALSLAVSRNGDRLAVSTHDDRLLVWQLGDLSDGMPESSLQSLSDSIPKPTIKTDVHGNSIRFVDFALDDSVLISGSENGSLIFLDAATLDALVTFRTGDGQIRNIVFSKDKRWMAVNSYVKPTYIWDFARVRSQLRSWKLDWE